MLPPDTRNAITHPQKMAGPGPQDLATLPDEVLLHIMSSGDVDAVGLTYGWAVLTPRDLSCVHLVSRYLRNVARDNNLWKLRCLEQSSFLESLKHRLALRARSISLYQEALLSSDANGTVMDTPVISTRIHGVAVKAEKTRIMANWDPTYASEQVNWYDEYIQRHGPICINWLQQPQVRDEGVSGSIEVRGVALYRPDGLSRSRRGPETVFAVSPLDDGSVCLWDVNGTRVGRRGAIVAKSQPGILLVGGPGPDSRSRSRRVDSGAIECVSVDSDQHRAFFAVQSYLIEVDLQTLTVSNCSSFPWSITTMSTANPSVPLTVGTSLGIHLHDYRSPSAHHCHDSPDAVMDGDLMGEKAFRERNLRNLFDDKPLPPMASLSQPGPLSILHLPELGSATQVSNDIYVAGRFSNILHYDRRRLQSIRGSIHSGARLSSLTSLPAHFSALESELRRKAELPKDQIEKSRGRPGNTLIACGEYGTKGSLELYGLSDTPIPDKPAGLLNATFKNRQTTAPSKLFSVVNHGTRLAFSDGSGFITWFERDGLTEIRRCRIGHSEQGLQTTSLFANMPGSDDIARKLLPTRSSQGVDARINDNDLLFWTGEKLGLLSFSGRPGFTTESFVRRRVTADEADREAQERAYSERMRTALERQADDVRLVSNLW